MKILLFLSLLINISCKSESATVEHIGSRFVLSFEKIKLKIFIATDEGGQGFLSNLLWVRGDLDDHADSFVLFNETLNQDSHKPNRRLWYAPDNKKLVEWEDVDGNGIWEIKTYFNRNANPENRSGIVAHTDFDLDQNGIVDLTWFPGIRWEQYDEKGNPVLFRKEVDPTVLKNFISQRKLALLGNFLPLANLDSWVLHPSLAPTDQWQAVYQP